MISKDYGQVKIDLTETPEDALEYYAINEIDGVSIVIEEDKSDDKGL